VEVDVEVQSAAKALHEDNGSAGWLHGAQHAGAAALALEHLGEEDLQRPRDQRRVSRQEEAGPPRQRQHPLAHGHAGDHVVEPVHRRALHAASGTRGAEAAALAREGHQELVSAGGAAHAGEAEGQDPAAQVALELRRQVAGQGAAVGAGGDFGEKGLPVIKG
jgi:hypothetical protein